GLNEATIQKHPELLASLRVATAAEGVEQLRQLARQLGTPDDRPYPYIAIRGGLAIDFPAGEGPDDRLRRLIASSPGKTAAIPRSERQARRFMQEGTKLLAGAVWRFAHPKPAEQLSPAEIVVSALRDVTSDTLDDTAPPAAAEPAALSRRRRGWRLGASLAAAVAILAVASYFAFFAETEPTAPTPDLALMAHYDGKDPRGIPPGNVKCAAPPPSEPVHGAPMPGVFGPEGIEVGVVQLRRSPICPVIWARVLWNGQEDYPYKIPDGWTLHVIIHRPATLTKDDATEPSRPTPIPHALSMMLTTQPGCVYVEVYFEKGGVKTTPAYTSCTT
ncbi:hypothetical protein, partial [Amycolatopsis lurida]|uniref:hypothetical protein n=1 Tax=Amycolatopsis lurida TaxID=31959 RepID=UPI003662F6BF